MEHSRAETGNEQTSALIIAWAIVVLTSLPEHPCHPWSAALLCGTGNDGLKSRTGVRRSVSVELSRFF
ncbi:hypothetical protein DBB_6790 [Desulfoluna spongiiphila]|nr:hypothetical protein DBB_6790 [Desulfoluna spongiiphila]